MSTSPALTDPSGPRPGSAGTVRRRRRYVSLIAAGGLLAGVIGVSTTATTGAASTAATLTAPQQYSAQSWGYPPRTGRGNPWSGDGSNGSGSTGGQTATAQSDTATTAEGTGVALIDTVLSNGEAAGTGIVLTSTGEVVTNYHVVEDSTSVRVTIANTGKAFTATVVGTDRKADIALLQLKGASGLTVATIDDDTVKTGDDVTAVGNAGGTGTLTAASGDVTDLSTSITTQAEESVAGETLKKVIETSADVVAGDSGGPLLDDEGEVVGIDTAASSGAEINGYAIPIDRALGIVAQIRTGEETSAVRIGPAAFLGVELSASTGSVGVDGAVVAGVVDGDAADQAGLAAGDTITKLGSTTITDATDLSAALAKRDRGDHVQVTWMTEGGSTHTRTVTLGASPVN